MAPRKAIDASPLSVEKRIRRTLRSINPETLKEHRSIASWAEAMADAAGNESNQPSEQVETWQKHMAELDRRFRGIYSGGPLRLIIHVPRPETAIAGYSVASNMKHALDYLGVPTVQFTGREDLADVLKVFRPSVMLTSWHPLVLREINWEAVQEYRATAPFLLGLIAAEKGLEGSHVVRDVLAWADQNNVAFFYKEDPPEYLDLAYHHYRDRGYPLVSIGYGANPLTYRPVDGIERDLDYVFLGSVHRDKWSRYVSHFSTIVRAHRGFLIGPGWPTGEPRTIGHPTHPYLYARGKVGLNLHHDRQLVLPLELNERTYNLAAAGIPQLVDRPPLLRRIFSEDALFIADSSRKYKDLFREVLSDPQEASVRATRAIDQVMSEHTVIHRIAGALNQIEALLPN